MNGEKSVCRSGQSSKRYKHLRRDRKVLSLCLSFHCSDERERESGGRRSQRQIKEENREERKRSLPFDTIATVLLCLLLLSPLFCTIADGPAIGTGKQNDDGFCCGGGRKRKREEAENERQEREREGGGGMGASLGIDIYDSLIAIKRTAAKICPPPLLFKHADKQAGRQAACYCITGDAADGKARRASYQPAYSFGRKEIERAGFTEHSFNINDAVDRTGENREPGKKGRRR